MKIFEAISNFGSSAPSSEEDFEERRELFLKEASLIQDEIYNTSASIKGISSRAELRLPDRSDCFFWIAKVCQRVLENDILLRRIKSQTMLIHSLKCLLDSDLKSADDFAAALDRHVKIKQKLRTSFQKNTAQSEMRDKEEKKLALLQSIYIENMRSSLEPQGIPAPLVVKSVHRINRAFPNSTLSSPIALLSHTISVTHRTRKYRIQSLYSLLHSKLPNPFAENYELVPPQRGRSAGKTLDPLSEVLSNVETTERKIENREPSQALLKFAQTLDSILRSN